MRQRIPVIRKGAGHEIALLDCTGHHFPPHYHDEIVLSLNLSGLERVNLQGREFLARPGDFTLYNPGDVQSSHAVAGRWRFISLYVQPSFAASLFDPDTPVVFEKSHLRHPLLPGMFRHALLAALRHDLETQETDELLVLLLQALLRHCGEPKARRKERVLPPPRLRHVQQRMLDDIATPPTLRELAAESDLSVARLTRMFKRATGLPPMQWLMNQRLHHARRALASGDSLAEIAARHGFADQAHFTRRFRALFGITPGAWRRALRR